MKTDWQWPAAMVFAVTCLTIGGLVYVGKLHPEAMMALLTWLAPTPFPSTKVAAAP